MKLLIFSAAFFPAKKCGGPPVSVNNFCTLMDEYECYVVASDHDLGETERFKDIKEGWNDRSNARVLYLSDKEFRSLKRIREIVDEVKPDWIYFQSFFQRCVFPGLIVAKEKHLKVLLATRGEMCKAAMAIKKYKKIPYILIIRYLGLVKNVLFQSTSNEETDGIIKWLRIKPEKIYRLENVPSIVENSYYHTPKKKGTGHFVFLARIHPIKNLDKALQYMYMIKGNVFFDIYGPIENKDYWEKCKELIRGLSDNIHVTYQGFVSHEEVHDVFSQYDALVFPTQSENFGHVIAESLAVGTPVIISDQTPWNDVNKYGAGYAIALNNPLSFQTHIQEIVDFGNEEMMHMRYNAKGFFEERMKIHELKESYKRVFENG